MPIVKTTVTLTVLHRDTDACLDGMPLEEIAALIDDGPAIGQVETTNIEFLADDNVEAELKAIGNDGTFFDSED